MKKALIITYYFPPSGGPGVQRVLKFVKYLPSFGWKPVVLTVTQGDYPARDESLLSEIPSHAAVYRTKIFEPYRLYRRLTGKPDHTPVDVENIPRTDKRRSAAELIAGFIRSTFFIPDGRIGWFPYAITEGMEIIRREGIEAIYSSSPPYTTAVVARKLSKAARVPWIAGFRDPWTGFLSTPNRWFIPAAVDRAMEHSVISDATMVEAAWRGILKDIMKKYPEIDCRKLIHLPNGFDSEDYPAIGPLSHDKFTVTYTGSMYGKRNPATFFKAVEELVRNGEVDRGKIQLNFVGRFGSEVHEILDSSAISGTIRKIPYLPHSQSIRELLLSDTLLLIVDEADGSEEIVPGKVFEYLGAGKPIIALAPEGAVAELIRETASGYVAQNQDIPSIKRAFLECYHNFVYHRRGFEQNKEAIRKYERKELTRQLAALLDAITTPSAHS